MRPVNKGNAPRAYTIYQDAIPDLRDRIGKTCSYCETNVSNSAEVEHVVPQNNGGAVLDWNNFLISCKQCNINKSDNNLNRGDYVWPDEDNTLKAIEFIPPFCVGLSTAQPPNEQTFAINTIMLCGLDKWPGGNREPTKKDFRWRDRCEAFAIAEEQLASFGTSPNQATAEIIGRSVSQSGFFSVYFHVFRNEPLVLAELIRFSTGIDPNCFDRNYNLQGKGKVT